MSRSPNPRYGTIRWILLSQLLLVIYLSFFNSVLDKSPTDTFRIGLGFATLATVVVVLCRNFFFNKFEYYVHLVIGLDIFLEGLVPWHDSFGFYYCALAFWSLFWTYHAVLLYRLYRRKPSTTPTVTGSENLENLPTGFVGRDQ